ncbi:hypothetical protein MLD38_006669 [Melastoma candidum]|uniref:Uncharacterized protein n=1 Tax=Melastoma candidum TaxID=119954 RepID=A0ACB9RPW4_9MYRT|nr:hypothetical protein MLD38_006669 [Melastoma candidum]
MSPLPDLLPLPRPSRLTQSMDWWFSWLSRTSLEPVLVYKYGIVLARNELQAEDISYFDHEFLWSMGIVVAKHRLEIIKLARKEKGRGSAAAGNTGPLSGFVAAISRTKKSFGRYIARLVYHEGAGIKASSKDPGKLQGKHKDDIAEFEKRSNLAFSGPMVDSRVQDRHLLANAKPRNSTWSGPLYPLPKSPYQPGNWYPVGSPKFLGRCRSPRLSGPLDSATNSPKFVYGAQSADYDLDDQSPWAQLFHDMKPT